MDEGNLKALLDNRVARYNRRIFIESDPISVPHQYSKKQDIEIAGFFSAIFSWGSRTTIIAKARELMNLMDNSPHRFILDHRPKDLRRMLGFKHRTFTPTDLLYFIAFLRHHYLGEDSLETAFTRTLQPTDATSEKALNGFYDYFFSLPDVPQRTRKHISSPRNKSGCKRLNMYLRWMVRKDPKGVDFGIWKRIHPSQLICPIDVHVARVAAKLGLLERKQVDWKAAEQLTEFFRSLDPRDPVKYDFALFGLGVMEKYY